MKNEHVVKDIQEFVNYRKEYIIDRINNILKVKHFINISKDKLIKETIVKNKLDIEDVIIPPIKLIKKTDNIIENKKIDKIIINDSGKNNPVNPIKLYTSRNLNNLTNDYSKKKNSNKLNCTTDTKESSYRDNSYQVTKNLNFTLNDISKILVNNDLIVKLVENTKLRNLLNL